MQEECTEFGLPALDYWHFLKSRVCMQHTCTYICAICVHHEKTHKSYQRFIPLGEVMPTNLPIENSPWRINAGMISQKVTMDQHDLSTYLPLVGLVGDFNVRPCF